MSWNEYKLVRLLCVSLWRDFFTKLKPTKHFECGNYVNDLYNADIHLSQLSDRLFNHVAAKIGLN